MSKENRDIFRITPDNHGRKPPTTQPRPPAPPSQKLNGRKKDSFDFIIELKEAVKRGDLRFYENDGFIYVKNDKGEAAILN